LPREDGICFHLLLFYASPNNIATKMHKPAGQKMQRLCKVKKEGFCGRLCCLMRWSIN